MKLLDLVRTILLLIRKPVSKVRLARLVYFAHKELIRKGIMQTTDIAYIRSPLGPIPEGFLTLDKDSETIVAKRNISSNLSYNSEDYAIDSRMGNDDADSLEQYRDILTSVEHTLKNLRYYTTPELISITHHEPSWLAHSNGERYYITTADLRNSLPLARPLHIKIRFTSSPNNSGAMQANLLRGMISDIVRESTDLEHPDTPDDKQKKGKQSDK